MFIAKLVKYLCRQRHTLFIENLRRPKLIQQQLQKELFQAHFQSPYGRHLKAKCWEEIPIVAYGDIQFWIEQGGITREKIVDWVETSGSTHRSKKIPYTRSLKKSFLSLFKIWAYDLLSNVLDENPGKIFMSLSPPVASGVKDDREYLSPLLRMLLRPYLVLPPTTAHNYRAHLIKTLQKERGLGVISIWNPTYLLNVLDDLKGDVGEAWPHLKLISCWTEGWAAEQAQALQRKFPHIYIQGKGLLATECPVTLPLHGAFGPVPLIDEVFLEFEDGSGTLLTLDQVRMGETYELIISQRGGLLRYRLGDQVKVGPLYYNTPCLNFVGKAGKVSDMVGEKLDEIAVEKALREETELVAPWVLLPLSSPHHGCRYLLVTEQATEKGEKALQTIYHYRIARITGQLGELETRIVPHLSKTLHSFYLKQGLNWGDIKDPKLITEPSIASQFVRELG